jgi:hypothetical protein
MILQWPDEAKKNICSILELKPGKALNRLFLEEAIPELMHFAGMEDKEGYRELLLRILEATAEACEVDYLKIYSFKEWLKTITTCPFHHQKNAAGMMESIIKISEGFFRPGREKKKEALLQFFINQRGWLNQMTSN